MLFFTLEVVSIFFIVCYTCNIWKMRIPNQPLNVVKWSDVSLKNLFLCSETSCEEASRNTATGVRAYKWTFQKPTHPALKGNPVPACREVPLKWWWVLPSWEMSHITIPFRYVWVDDFPEKGRMCELCGGYVVQWTHNNQGLLEDYMWICEHDARFMQKPQKHMSVKVTSMFVTQNESKWHPIRQCWKLKSQHTPNSTLFFASFSR